MKKIKIEENVKKTEIVAKKAIEDYKQFAIKGNIVDLAIGVVIGAAFTNIVNAIVTTLVTPLLSLLTNKVDISTLFVSLTKGNFSSIEEAKNAGAIIINYGLLLNAILNFFIVSVVLFVIFKYISKLKNKNENLEQKEKEDTTKICPYCMSSVNINAVKCPFCTSDLK